VKVLKEEKSELSEFTQEIEKAIFNSEILRNRLTIDIKTPESFKQGYKIVYRNKGKITKDNNEQESNSLNCIRLTHRRKKAPGILSIFDREGKKLTIVPSDLVQNALCEICRFYLSRAKELNTAKYVLDKLIKNTDFSSIFAYNSDPKLVNKACRSLEDIENEIYSESALKYYRRTYALVKSYEYFYIPIVKLETLLKPGDFMSIDYWVRTPKATLKNWSLYIFGFFTISLPLELESTATNHITAFSPPGMVFRHANISGLEDPDLLEKYGNLDNFLGEDMFSLPVPKEDAKKIEKIQENNIEKGKEIRFNIDLGISKYSLIRILTFLMYAVVFIPLISFLFPFEQFGFSLGFSLIKTSILIILGILASLVAYSIDKPFLHIYLAAQIIIILIIFTIEIFLLLIYLYPF
jgi:hypothetical protein